MIVAQTNEQVDDLIERLGVRIAGAGGRPAVRGRLRGRPTRVRAHPACRVGAKVADLGVAAGHHRHGREMGDRHRGHLAVGDRRRGVPDALGRAAAGGAAVRAGAVRRRPGPARPVLDGRGRPLDRPVLGSDAERGRRAAAPQPRPAGAPPAGVLAAARLGGAGGGRRPSTRSPGSAPGTGPGRPDAGLRRPRAATALDEVLDAAAATGWGLHELPARFTVRTDAEAAAACAAWPPGRWPATAVAVSEAGRRPADRRPDRDRRRPPRPGRGDPARCCRPRRAGVTVDTANRLQGREYDLTVVLHPLSGRRDATAFHLESGRLCVLTSRHRHACVVVARAGHRRAAGRPPVDRAGAPRTCR